MSSTELPGHLESLGPTINIRPGWTKQRMKDLVVHWVPPAWRSCANNGVCAVRSVGPGLNGRTRDYRCAWAAMLPDSVVACLEPTIGAVQASEVFGSNANILGPFLSGDDAVKFAMVHDNAPEGLQGTQMHEMLFKWIDNNIIDNPPQ